MVYIHHTDYLFNIKSTTHPLVILKSQAYSCLLSAVVERDSAEYVKNSSSLAWDLLLSDYVHRSCHRFAIKLRLFDLGAACKYEQSCECNDCLLHITVRLFLCM